MDNLIKRVFDFLLYYLTDLNLSPFIVILNFVVAAFISLIIYFVYKTTYTGVAYSKSFNVSLVIITLLTTAVMMIIRSSISLSLGMVGALSIVRFRTALKQPKDIAYMFWAITTGLSIGAGAYLLAIVCGVFVTVFLFVFKTKNSFELSYLLMLSSESIDDDAVDKILKQYTKRFSSRNKKINARQCENMYEIHLKKGTEKQLVQSLVELDIEDVELIAYTNDIGI